MYSETEQITTGSIIADRYRVERFLGEGGMGKVFLVSDTLLEGSGEYAHVALKLLTRALSDDERYQRRFMREFALTREVTHPNVVRTFEMGKHQSLLFFTMEFVEGEPLADRARRGVDPELAINLFLEIAKGVSSLHERGIIHRDLKSQNVLVRSDGEIKISDFGIARPILSDLTTAREIVGSALYMPPEVWLGEDVTLASDIYSLGIIGYELLTGILPFDGEAELEVMWKHLEAPVVAPLFIQPATPRWISDLVVEMLSKDQFARPSIEQVANTFDSNINSVWSSSRGSSARSNSRVPEFSRDTESLHTEEDLSLIQTLNNEEARKQEIAAIREGIEKQRCNLPVNNQSESPWARKTKAVWRIALTLFASFLSYQVLTQLVLAWFAARWSSLISGGGWSFLPFQIGFMLAVAALVALPILPLVGWIRGVRIGFRSYLDTSLKMTLICFLIVGLLGFQRGLGQFDRDTTHLLRRSIATLTHDAAGQSIAFALLLPPIPPGDGTDSRVAMANHGIAVPDTGYGYMAEKGLAMVIFLYCLSAAAASGLLFASGTHIVLSVLMFGAILPQLLSSLVIESLYSNYPGFAVAQASFQIGPFALSVPTISLWSGIFCWIWFVLVVYILRRPATKS